MAAPASPPVPTTPEIKLRVAEAVQDDVNKGIVRIDTAFMHQIGVRPGDIVEIKGERVTVAIADRAYPADMGLGIIKMDGLIRRNAKTGIGEVVTVRKANVKEAKKVVIAPTKGIIIQTKSNMIFKQGLLGRAMVKGDIVSLGGAGSRRSTLSSSPFFDDVFHMMDEVAMNFGLGDLKFVVTETNPKESVIVTEMTDVVYNPNATEVKEEIASSSGGVSYEDLGGLDDEIKRVREMVELPLKHPELFTRLGIDPPKGVLLHGPPGTGKTLLAKAVASETDTNFFLINGPEIMSKYYGQSEENLRKKFEEAEQKAPSIIFIDEIDAIASKREETHGEVEKRVVAQLLAIMDGLKSRGRVVVIAASNIPNSLDPALRRPGRFDREIEINVPSEKGRLEILKIHTRNMPLTKKVDLKKLSKITYGFVGADLAALAREAAMVVLKRVEDKLKLKKDDEQLTTEELEALMVTQTDFIEALKTVRPSAAREILVEIPDITWDDIGGLEDVKQELKEAIEWPLKNKDSFARMGVKPPKGVLLFGPPGTGKTLLAKAAAKESEANFIVVKGSELISKWVNETPQLVKKLFAKARQLSPVIIFIDEIDAIAPSRQFQRDVSSGMSAVNSLLTEMDGLEELNDIIIVAATNRPDIIDPALLRPGRFDRIVLVPVPDEAGRKEIFKIHTKKMPLAKDVGIEKLVEQTQDYVGADIEAVCREAAMLALREDMKSKEVKMKHFTDSLKKIRASSTKEVQEMYAQLIDSFRAAKAKEMKDERPNYMG